jgi:hypothetical protein
MVLLAKPVLDEAEINFRENQNLRDSVEKLARDASWRCRLGFSFSKPKDLQVKPLYAVSFGFVQRE